MLIDSLKFLHILCALTLFGCVLFNFVTSFIAPKKMLSVNIDYLSLVIIIVLFITASFLVIPKGYTFATPWINVAFTFLTIVMIQMCIVIYLKVKKNCLKNLLTLNYGIMLIILVMIIHDAVTKHTLW